MPLENINEIRQRYDAWWRGRADQPLMYLIFPEGEVDFSPYAKDWMSPEILRAWTNWKQEMLYGQALQIVRQTGDWRYADEAIDLLDYYARVTGHAGEGFSFLLPGLGPSCLAGYITGFSEFQGSTIWFALHQPWSFERTRQIRSDMRNEYRDIAVEGVRRLVDRLQHKFVIAIPDLGVGLDALSAVRGVQNLLMDMIDRPDDLQPVLRSLEGLWRGAYDEMSAIIDPGNHGCCVETMRYLSGDPTHIAYCDFSAMISPGMFQQFVMPTLEREAERFAGRLVWHLDGPGQIGHVPHLCRVDGLRAIQWVPGAGNPGGLDECWYGLYRQILDAGKNICLSGAGGGGDDLRKLFAAFPKQRFYVPMVLRNRREAEDVLRIRDEA